jgi:hypothetical protein
MRPDIKPGATLPDYELPDHARKADLSPFHGWDKRTPSSPSAA